jgi:predicted HAD superfamily Cof-like phosphohydrolase
VDAGQDAGAVNGGGDIATPNLPLAAFRGLDHAFLQVRSIEEFFGNPIPDTPTMQPLDEAKARADWIRSECVELEDARTLEDQADAYLDILVFGLGGMVKLGILPQSLFDYVIDSQFTKVFQAPNGPVVVKDIRGKVIKPPQWEENHAPEPKIRAEISRQINAALLRNLTA